MLRADEAWQHTRAYHFLPYFVYPTERFIYSILVLIFLEVRLIAVPVTAPCLTDPLSEATAILVTAYQTCTFFYCVLLDFR